MAVGAIGRDPEGGIQSVDVVAAVAVGGSWLMCSSGT
jgi:hypothetical protein